MIDYKEALRLILERAPEPTASHTVSLDDALGMVLAEDAVSDVDLPPFDKSGMDGFALRARDLESIPATLEVVMDIPAGTTPSGPIQPGQAAAIMTGAPLPPGADTVVQVELTSGFGEPRVIINSGLAMGSNVSPRGEIVGETATVLSRGTRLGVEEIGLLAAVGCDPVTVFARPTVGIISTGDEVVAPSEKPGPSQIRDVNGPAIAAFIRSLGLEPVSLGRVNDDPASLLAAVESGLEYDCLLMSGGVSAGAYDFVEDVLAKLNVDVHTRRIAVKPGKPTVFGTREEKMIFGLPGNPVSTMVIAQLMVGPALKKRMGMQAPDNTMARARLSAQIEKKANRAWFVHGVLTLGEEVAVRPLINRGSADIPTAVGGNCLILAPRGETLLPAGEMVDVVVWERSL